MLSIIILMNQKEVMRKFKRVLQIWKDLFRIIKMEVTHEAIMMDLRKIVILENVNALNEIFNAEISQGQVPSLSVDDKIGRRITAPITWNEDINTEPLEDISSDSNENMKPTKKNKPLINVERTIPSRTRSGSVRKRFAPDTSLS
uniref:Uncharacterized protein n=1 Tax=Lepeophtheirus salmonis TaxID=72036 RepID=A0A0K2UZB5_LEPSM